MAKDSSPSREAETQAAPFWRRLLAESVGTFVLVVAAAGSDVVDALSGGQIGHVARYLAPAIAVMAMIWSISGVSGAHLNPAVSWAFFIRGVFPGRLLPGYVAAQLAGALAAAFLLKAMFGPAIARGITGPSQGFSIAAAFGAEMLLAFALVFVILATADQKAIVGKNAALAVGGVIALCGLGFSPISGSSMNPARTLGPMIAAGAFDNLWIYVAGPLLGASVAVGIVWLLFGSPQAGDRQAAQGA